MDKCVAAIFRTTNVPYPPFNGNPSKIKNSLSNDSNNIPTLFYLTNNKYIISILPKDQPFSSIVSFCPIFTPYGTYGTCTALVRHFSPETPGSISYGTIRYANFSAKSKRRMPLCCIDNIKH